MKVLITTDWYEPVVNGVVTSVKNLAAELKKTGHEVRILTLSRTSKSYVENNVFYIGSVSAEKIYPQARLKLPISGKYIKELLDWHPDIIHSQCEFSTFLLARRLAFNLRIPMIHTYHTVYEDYTHYFSHREKWGKELVRRMTRKLSEQVGGIIAPSEKIRKLLSEYQVECPVWVIPSGIDVSRYKREKNDGWRERIRRQYGILPDTAVLLYVGRLAREKNVEEIILYQEMIKKRNAVLMIVEDGPFRRELEMLAEKKGLLSSIIFTGMVSSEDIWKYYQAGDLFVSASTSETQGMTYGEALASGLPLLCKKDECLNGVVEDGRNGWQYRSKEEFLNRFEIWDAMDEKGRERLCRNAEKSAGMFSAEQFGRSAARIYEQEIREEAKAV